jgi:two-component system phosphate regulon response regulator PhoB
MQTYRDACLEVDYEAKRVVMNFTPVHLTPSEFRLLATLVRNTGNIVLRSELLREVCGCSPEARTRSLDVHLRRLRFKLGDDRREHLQTVFGVGYRMRPFGPESRAPVPVNSADSVVELQGSLENRDFLNSQRHCY